MKKFAVSMLIALGVMGFGVHTDASDEIDTPVYSDAQWSADGGIPVELPFGILYLFGDTVKPDSFTHNSAILVSYGMKTPLWHTNSLLPDTEDSWYWPADAAWTDAGLMVVANEIKTDSSSFFGFESFDTDMFLVRDPSSVMSWQLAEKMETGPWDGMNVSFLNAQFAVAKELGSSVTYVVDMTKSWEMSPIADMDSDGMFIPVQAGDQWYGLTWSMTSTEVLVWRLVGDASWEVVDIWQGQVNSYGHQLHSVDGRIIYVRSVPGNGYESGRSIAFPEYQDVTEEVYGYASS